MVLLFRFICDNCDFAFMTCGPGTYVLNVSGQRVPCITFVDYFAVTAMAGEADFAAGGTLRPFLCASCRKEVYLDADKDARACPECGSRGIWELGRLEGEVCLSII